MSKTRSRKECERQKMKRILEKCLVMVASQQWAFLVHQGECLRLGKTKEGMLWSPRS